MEKKAAKRQQKGVHANSRFFKGGRLPTIAPPPSESYNYNEKNVVEKPPHGENEAKITPYNGKKISLIFQWGVGAIERLLLPPPPRAPMVVFPPVEFAKALISPKIIVHAHACDKTNK